MRKLFQFDRDAPARCPPAARAGVTGRGPQVVGRSRHVRAEQAHVLKQIRQRYLPLVREADGVVETATWKFGSQPLTGREIRPGGVVWRWKDGDNYYVARATRSRTMFAYYTANGRRNTISTSMHPVSRQPRGIRCGVGISGKKMRVSLDGKTIHRDGRRPHRRRGCGRVWTKAAA